MDLKLILTALQDYEARGLLNPSEAISDFGYEKVSEIISLMQKARDYNIPEHYYLPFLNEIRKSDEIKPISYPAITLDEEPLQAPLSFEMVGEKEKELAPSYSLFISQDISDSLFLLSKEGKIKLSVRDIAILAGCDPSNTGTARKISSLLDPHYTPNLLNDPTRVARTRTKVYEIDLMDDINYSDLNAFLLERKQEAWNKKLPIVLVDYLSGAESQYGFFLEGKPYELVLDASLISKFGSVFKKNYAVAHGEEIGSADVIPRTNLNFYLLDRALKQSFPVTPLEDLVEDLALPHMTQDHRKELCAYVRQEMSMIEVAVGADADKYIGLDTALSGFTYLIAYSILSAIIAEGGLPQPF